jgi:hypothetical protein
MEAGSMQGNFEQEEAGRQYGGNRGNFESQYDGGTGSWGFKRNSNGDIQQFQQREQFFGDDLGQ